MYRSKVYEENDNDASEYELEKMNLYCAKAWEYRLSRQPEQVAHCIMPEIFQG